MPFVYNNHDHTYTLTIPMPSNKLPLIVAFPKDNDQATLLKEATLSVDRMDGSIHDSDGCEKEMIVTIDLERNEITLQTLPEDRHFWEGTEYVEKMGSLGYYERLFLDQATSRNLEYLLEEDDKFDEVFLWSRNFILAYHSELLDKPENQKVGQAFKT